MVVVVVVVVITLFAFFCLHCSGTSWDIKKKAASSMLVYFVTLKPLRDFIDETRF